VLGQADRAAVAHLVDAILDSDPDAVIERFGALVGGGLDLMVLSIQILEHFRDLTLASVCRSPDVFRGATESEIEAIRSQAKRADVTRLGQLFDRFTRIVDRLPTSRVQRLLLEMGLLELAHSEPLVPIGDLVERLQALGAGGDGGGPTGASGASRRGSGGARGGVASGGRRAAGQREAPGSTAAAATSPEPPGEPQFESEFEKKLWKMGQGAVTKPPAPPAELSPFADERAGPPGPGEGSPCTPAPPAAGIIDLEHLEAFEAFEELVGRIRAEDEYVSAVLGEVGLVTLADGVLRVAAPPRSFAHTELTGRPEIRAQVEQATRDHFGRPFSLELVEGEASLPDLPSIVLMQAKRREEHRATVEAEAREHAAIRSLVETFDARITTTKPLQDPPLRTTPRQGT
jgi:hypothetical protein